MRFNAVDHRLPLTRRAFLQGAGLALAAGFTSIAGRFLDWLTRICRLDVGPCFAGA